MDEQTLGSLADQLADLIINAKRTVVFTGAGISTESGIPDFRSPGGIWSRYDPEDFTYQKFVSDPAAKKKLWQMLREGGLTTEVEPNPAHCAIAELDRLGKLDCVITQNVDNLHQEAGVPAAKVLELHGNMQQAICLSCGRGYPFKQVKARIDANEEIPDCEACHGILKPDFVFFGETLPAKVLQEATARSCSCDLFIVIGSTLSIAPASYMPIYALKAGAKLVIINLSSTPMDQQASVLVRSKAGETMTRVIQQVREKISG